MLESQTVGKTAVKIKKTAKKEQSKGLSGFESLDFSFGVPPVAPNLSFLGADKAAFEIYEGGWKINESGYLRFKLNLSYQHGVVLIPELRRAQQSDASALIKMKVNSEEWIEHLDPLNLNYYKQSWYLPNYKMAEGENTITLSVIPDAGTDVFLRSISVMRFDLERQQKDFWCWAAVTASITRFFESSSALTQCQIVNRCLLNVPPTDQNISMVLCCGEKGGKSCDQPFSLTDALEKLNMSVSRCNFPLTLTEIRDQITAGLPVVARIEWDKGGAHFIVLTAIGPSHPDGDDATWLRVADPLDKVASYIPYRTIRDRYKGTGKWVHSYIVKRK